MKYVVTAENRLTGLREAISSPCGFWKAELAKRKYRDMQKKSGKQSAWLRLKVEPALQTLNFTSETI